MPGAGTSLVVGWLRLSTSNAGGQGSTPGQGTRSHTLQLKIPHTATKIWYSQINKNFKKPSPAMEAGQAGQAL